MTVKECVGIVLESIVIGLAVGFPITWAGLIISNMY